MAPSIKPVMAPSGAWNRLGVRCRGGGRGVLELLLRTEELVQHHLARVLAQDQDQGRAEDRHEQGLTEPEPAAGSAAAKLLRSIPQRLGRRAQIALNLLASIRAFAGPLPFDILA